VNRRSEARSAVQLCVAGKAGAGRSSAARGSRAGGRDSGGDVAALCPALFGGEAGLDCPGARVWQRLGK